jgi:hypothetical protein
MIFSLLYLGSGIYTPTPKKQAYSMPEFFGVNVLESGHIASSDYKNRTWQAEKD